MSEDHFPRLKEILSAALDLPSDERIAYLEETCGDDLDLLREALSLIAFDADENTVLATHDATHPDDRSAGTRPRRMKPGTPENDGEGGVTDSGQMLSHYRLVEKIGEGGMGVVWKARDTVLGRTVAIKVLPSGLANDDDRRKLLFDEARLASSLNEAHIVQIYEFGRSENLDFIVMEYVDGRPLNRLFEGRPLPSEMISRLGFQVARALSRAHRKGLLHRDLKPANILVTEDGDAKIVDFGLATLFAPGDTSLWTRVETRAQFDAEAVNQRAIVGTIPYMSPEQARGEELDARSDIFSMGVVLYEMAAGQRPFRGPTSADVVSEVMKANPRPLQELNPKLPIELSRIIHKCLSRPRQDRYQNIEDLAVDLRRLTRELESGSSPSYEELGLAIPRQLRWWRLAATLAALTVLAVLAVVFVPRWVSQDQNAPRSLREQRLTTNTADSRVGRNGRGRYYTQWGAEISPDGRFVVYETGNGLFLREIGTGEVRELTPFEGTDQAEAGWFPDGSRLLLGLFPEGSPPTLWIYSLVTGAKQLIRRGVIGFGASPDGKSIVFTPTSDGAQEIWVMEANGSNPRLLVAPAEGDTKITWWVRWSPDSRRIAFRRQRKIDDGYYNAIEVVDVEDGSRFVMVEPILHYSPGIHGAWLTPDRFVFARVEEEPLSRDTSLWEVLLNPKTARPRGDPQRVITWPETYALSLSSTRDGDQLALVKARDQTDLLVSSFVAGGGGLGPPVRLTSELSLENLECWFPTSHDILFSSNRRGTFDLFRIDVRTKNWEVLVSGSQEDMFGQITPDGQWILYASRELSPEVATLVPNQYMRVAAAGGAPQKLMDTRSSLDDTRESLDLIQCGVLPGSGCVLGEIDENGMTYFRIDPMVGTKQELGRTDLIGSWLGESWLLSPDGTQVARRTIGDKGEVWIFEFESGRSYPLERSDGSPISMVSWGWCPKGECLVGTIDEEGERSMARVYLDGRMETLTLEGMDELPAGTILVSPDGAYLAFSQRFRDSDVWMVEGF